MAARNAKLLTRSTVVLLMLVLSLTAREAAAFAFLGNAFDATGQPQADFGRRLWNIAPGAPDPNDNNRRHLVLKYWINNDQVALDPIDPATGLTIAGAPKINTKPIDNLDQNSIKTAIDTWNTAARTLTPAAGPNVLPDKSSPGYDLLSTALHEIGHALGLHHPNQDGGLQAGLANYFAATVAVTTHAPPLDFSKKPGNDGVPGTADDVLGPDLRLQNFALANGPMTGAQSILPSKAVQWTPGSVKEGVDAGGKKTLTRVLPAQGVTEAVMVQGAFPSEVQADLASDDIAGLRALQSGRDFFEGANPNNKDSSNNPINDNFVFDIELAATKADANIVIYNVGNLAQGVGQTTALRAGNRSGPVQTLLDTALDTDTLLAATEVWPAYQGLDITGADIFLDVAAHAVDEPAGTLAFVLALAVLLCGRGGTAQTIWFLSAVSPRQRRVKFSCKISRTLSS